MGCCAARKPYQDEETTICQAESSLNFQSNSPAAILASVLIHSKSGRISLSQLSTLAQTLQLPFPQSLDADTPNSSLLKALLLGEDIDARKFALLGINLSHGSDAGKAQAFFDLLDSANKKAITRLHVTNFLEDLTAVFINSTPVLVLQDAKIAQYQAKLRANRARAIINLEQRMLKKKETLTKEEFVETFKDPDVQALASPRKLRGYIAYGVEEHLGLSA